MRDTGKSAADPDRPTIYQIRIKGHLDDQWTGWFEGMTISRTEGGDTVLNGQVIDQAALHGLLRKIRDLGLHLLAVIPVEPDETSSSDFNQ